MAGARGWVYIITNKAMPGLIKVGFSMKDPMLRAKELNHTGSPHPYIVEYDAMVHAPRRLEQEVHATLSDRNEGKEWFRCTALDALTVIRMVAKADIISETVHNETILAQERKPVFSGTTTKAKVNASVSRSSEIARKPFRSTGTFQGTCDHCRTSFSVTLTRYDTVARCPKCFRVTDISDFKRKELLL